MSGRPCTAVSKRRKPSAPLPPPMIEAMEQSGEDCGGEHSKYVAELIAVELHSWMPKSEWGRRAAGNFHSPPSGPRDGGLIITGKCRAEEHR